MFIDEVTLQFIAGKGGDGCVSWRKEKCIPKGWPYGWDGGNGGNIVLFATENVHTLSDFRHNKKIKANDGEKGATKEMHGANGKDTTVLVPVGTIVFDAESGETITDLNVQGETFLLCRWGRGGYGNAHFASSTRQAPAFAELWDAGVEQAVRMELKLVADVGIIGLPNAGKSTFISVVTSVRPKIADYPFTTLIPNLGVMEYKKKHLVLADVPGLIPWASEGKGLGIRFLKHVERTKALLHLVDVGGEQDAWEAYRSIREELQKFSDDLASRKEIVVLTKIDAIDETTLSAIIKTFQKNLPKGSKVLSISSATRKWVEDLQNLLISEFAVDTTENKNAEVPEKVKVYNLKETIDPKDYKIRLEENGNVTVRGTRLEQIVRMTNMENPEAVARVYDILEKIGALRKIGNLLQNDQKNNDHFFEGNEDKAADAKIEIAGKIFPLQNVLFRKF